MKPSFGFPAMEQGLKWLQSAVWIDLVLKKNRWLGCFVFLMEAKGILPGGLHCDIVDRHERTGGGVVVPLHDQMDMLNDIIAVGFDIGTDGFGKRTHPKGLCATTGLVS